MAIEHVNRANFEFFNSLSGDLDIQLTERPVEISARLENQKALPTAEIVSVKLSVRVFLEDAGDFRELTPEELSKEVLVADQLVLRSHGVIVNHKGSATGRWSVAELLSAVEETETQTRAQSEWFGGIDVHHTYFEGILWDGEAWEIQWGS